jgi:branched-chain amino acid transport system ATP-binding protein
LLNLKNISVHYNGIEVVKGVSIDTEEGAVTTLIGANGAGKSTILRAISGLVTLAFGEIWFRGERIDGLKPDDIVKKGITHVPEGRGIFPWMSVYDNLMTGAYLRKDEPGIKRDMEKVYGYFPVLKKMSKRLGRDMSGGEQQMLAFGRGLLANPKLYLLDEPSIGLAPILVEDVMRTVERIAKEEGLGVVLVEQNASLALNVAKKAYVLELGKVVLEGSANELRDHPEVKKAYLGM